MTTDATPREVGSHAGLGLAPERAALPNRWRVVCTPGAEPYFERHAEGAWAQRERVDAEIAAAVAAEREPANVVLRALLLAAWDAPGTRTAGEMRAAAVTLFGAAAVDAAMARIRA